VDTKTGEDWFVHFQDRYAYGRIVHLQPMRWEHDWPVIGIDEDKNGIGEPVSAFKKPNVGETIPLQVPQTSDEFDSSTLGLQWQWEANYKDSWFSLDARKGWFRFYSQLPPQKYRNLWNVPGLMLQKMPAPAFSATARLDCAEQSAGEKSGLVVFGLDYSYVGINKSKTGYTISQAVCQKADKGTEEETTASVDITGSDVYLRAEVRPEQAAEIIPMVICSFSYSLDGKLFHPLGRIFTAREGLWVGAKIGVFVLGSAANAKPGYTDVDWFRIEQPANQ
jgi:beta-xylosidase